MRWAAPILYRPLQTYLPTGQNLCAEDLVELPAEPETAAAFLASEASAGLKPATIARRANSGLRIQAVIGAGTRPRRPETASAQAAHCTRVSSY